MSSAQNQAEIISFGDDKAAKAEPFRVVIAGEFSTGKSSVLNLLAREIVAPTTVEYSRMPLLGVTWGRKRAFNAVEGKKRRTESSITAVFDKIKKMPDSITAHLTHPDLAGIELIEAPLSPDGDFEDDVLPLIEKADMVIWCTSANQAWKLTEKSDIEMIPEEILERSVLVATRADLLDDSDIGKVNSRLNREAGKIFDSIMFIGASRQICQEAGDPRIWLDSGGEALMEVIQRVGRSKIEAFREEVQKSGGEIANLPDLPDGKVEATEAEALNDMVESNIVTLTAVSDTGDKKSVAEAKKAKDSAGDKEDKVEEPAKAEPAPVKAAEEKPEPAKKPASNQGWAPNMIEQDLGALKDLSGFIGACLVDSESGIMLGSAGGSGSHDLEVAAAGNTEILKAQATTSNMLGLKDDVEDILISLGSQYHLIRPVSSNRQVFLYVALDRSAANLGLARMTVKQVESRMQLG